MSKIIKRKSFIRNESTDIETKLKIMKEFKEITKEEIKGNTVYKGYNIGIWQLNLRNKYLHGNLNIAEELEKEFIKVGVLGERKRNKRTTDLDKYNMFMDFHKKNPDSSISLTTIDNKGNPIGKYRNWLQIKINEGRSDLTEEQINKLKELNFINPNGEEIEKICRQYNISSALVKEILKISSSVEEFVTAYKKGIIQLKHHKINRRGIIVSQNDLTMNEKQKYLLLIENIFGEDTLKDNSKFVVEEDINKAIESLSPKEKIVILERYDPSCVKRKTYGKIAPKLNLTGERIKQINNDALIKLKEILPIRDISQEIQLTGELLRKMRTVEDTSFEQWQKEKLDFDIRFLDLTDDLIKKLKEKGYTTVADLSGVSEEELLKIRGVGIKKVNNILENVSRIVGRYTQEDKDKELKDLKEKINGFTNIIQAYYKAYDYYMCEEDMFNNQGIIPASIVPNENSILGKKKMDKINKEKRLEEIENESNMQDRKKENLETILGTKTTEKID